MAKYIKDYPTQERIDEMFYYEDGFLRWKKSKFACYNGKIAGAFSGKANYRQIKIDNKFYYAHRLIWILHYGCISKDLEIDHIDSNPMNNKIENLQPLTPKQNQEKAIRIPKLIYAGQAQCNQCGKIDTKSKITRYHNDNCGKTFGGKEICKVCGKIDTPLKISKYHNERCGVIKRSHSKCKVCGVIDTHRRIQKNHNEACQKDK